MNPILRRFLFQAAHELATNPETREKTARLYHEKVEPRAQDLWHKPEVEAAKRSLLKTAADLRRRMKEEK